MRTLAVVDGHGFPHHPGGLDQIGGALQQKLGFQDAVDPLGQGILVAVVAIGHRAGQAVATVEALVILSAVLNPVIGVMDQDLAGLAPLQGHP